jgi:hypothetical protein
MDQLLAILQEALRCTLDLFSVVPTLGLMATFYRHKAPNKPLTNLIKITNLNLFGIKFI